MKVIEANVADLPAALRILQSSLPNDPILRMPEAILQRFLTYLLNSGSKIYLINIYEKSFCGVVIYGDAAFNFPKYLMKNEKRYFKNVIGVMLTREFLFSYFTASLFFCLAGRKIRKLKNSKELAWLAIDAQYQNKGYASKLLKFSLENELITKNSIWVKTLNTNSAAIATYKKSGFRVWFELFGRQVLIFERVNNV